MDLASKWRLGGLVLGLTVALSMMHGGTIALALPAFALCLLLGVLIGEITLPRPEPAKRAQAMLEVRHIKDYLPRPAAWGVVALSLASVATVIALPLLIGERWAQRYGMSPSGIGQLPALATIGAGLALAWILLSRMVKRPRTGVEGDALRQDDAWRKRTAHTITAACGVLVCAPITGGALVASSLLGGDDANPIAAWCASLAAAVALVVVAHYVVMLLRPQVGVIESAQASVIESPQVGVIESPQVGVIEMSAV